MNRTLATLLAVLLSSAISLFLLIVLRRRLSEEFTAEGFASAVIAQNPSVFERLAEMEEMHVLQDPPGSSVIAMSVGLRLVDRALRLRLCKQRGRGLMFSKQLSLF